MIIHSFSDKAQGSNDNRDSSRFMFHILFTSISRSLYFDSFSVSLLPTFRSDGTDISMKIHLFSFLSLITISGLFAVISLSVWIGMSHSMITSFPSVTVLGLCSYHLEGTAIS